METLPLLILFFFLAEFLVAIWVGIATPFEQVRKLLGYYGWGVFGYLVFAIPMFWIFWSYGPEWLAYGYYLGVPIALVCLHTFAVALHVYLGRHADQNAPTETSPTQRQND